MLVFLHLSDIHFSKRPRTSPYELDELLRHELELDSAKIAKELGGVSAIIISGDIAFSGKREQYQNARSWLDELAAHLRVNSENTWMVPGNHDIDQDVQSDNATAAALRVMLREVPLKHLDSKLDEFLNDRDAARILFAPLENYTNFATDFASETTPANPAWTVTFDLGHGYTLSVRGVNSALASDRSDKESTGKMVIGAMQTQLLRNPGVIHMTVCHHPPSWIRDATQLKRSFDNKAAVQLTGHIHEHAIEPLETSLRVAAGATHPARSEPNWEPRYNVLSVEVVDSPQTCLEVCVYSRVWNPAADCFGDDPEGRCRTHHVKLDDVVRLPQPVTGEPPVNDPSERYEPPQVDAPVETIANRDRRVAYRLSQLRSGDRRNVAREVGMTTAQVARLRPHEFVHQVMAHARASGKLDNLWDAVEVAHGVPEPPPNPYASEEEPTDE